MDNGGQVGMDRRRALGVIVGGAGAAWVAPSILRIDAVGATVSDSSGVDPGSGSPPGGTSTLLLEDGFTADGVAFEVAFAAANLGALPECGDGFSRTSLVNWNVTGDVDLLHRTRCTDLFDPDPDPPDAGAWFLDLDGGGGGSTLALSNGLTVTSGRLYTLLFAVAGNLRGSPTTNQLTVTFGPQTVVLSVPQSRQFAYASPISFTASANGPLNLSFQTPGSGGIGPLLDHVRIFEQII
jgi:hypothetical protein